MRILALETSTEWCSAAVGDGARWHCRDERVGHAHSERLLPLVDAALADAGWALRDLDGIAFGAGPGSFTGIRIGCGVAQGLAFAGSLPVIPIPTLAALAQQAFRDEGWPCVVACLDARMREVYVAAYARANDGWREVAAAAVVVPGELALSLPNAIGQWAGAGSGFAAYPALASHLLLSKTAPDAHPTAQSVGELALAPLAAGAGVAAADALPIYVRHRIALTTAEREAGVRL